MITLLWLFPIIFMIHDFEEIIMMKPWFKRQGCLLKERFPRVAGGVIGHYEKISTSALAFGVALMFLMLSIITFISVYLGQYQLWFGLLMGFLLHLLIHIGQWIIFKRCSTRLLPAATLITVNQKKSCKRRECSGKDYFEKPATKRETGMTNYIIVSYSKSGIKLRNEGSFNESNRYLPTLR